MKLSDRLSEIVPAIVTSQPIRVAAFQRQEDVAIRNTYADKGKGRFIKAL